MNNKQIKIDGKSNKEFNQTLTLWRYRDLANYLQISEHKIRRDVMARKIPFTKIGKCVRFVPEEIKEWLKQNTTIPEQKQ